MIIFNVRKRTSKDISTRKDKVSILVYVSNIVVFEARSESYGMSVQEAVDSVENFLSKMRAALVKSGVNSKVERGSY